MPSIFPSKLSSTLLLSTLCLGIAAPQSAHITDEEEELIIIIVPTVVGVLLIGIIISTIVLCKKRKKEKEVDMTRDLEVGPEQKAQNQKKESGRSPVGSPLASSRSSQLSPGRPWDPKLSLLSRSKSNTSVEFANQSSLHDEEDDAVATQNPISTLVPRQISEVKDRRVSSSLKGVRSRTASQADPYSSSEESADTDSQDTNDSGTAVIQSPVKSFPIIPVPSMAELPGVPQGEGANLPSSRSRSSSHSSKSSEKSRSRSSSKAETPLPSIALQAASELAVTPPNVTADDEDLLEQRAINTKPSSPKGKKKKHRSKLESDE